MILNESKKLLLSSGRGSPKPQDVFATSLYTGNGGAEGNNQAIVNGVNLLEKGGLVWAKGRTYPGYTLNHMFADTVRGITAPTRWTASDTTNGEVTNGGSGQQSGYIRDLSKNGFSVAQANGAGPDGLVNASGVQYVAWTFRRAPKFFDVVTYTGDGTSNRQIPHNLKTVPGMIIIKCRNQSANSWVVHHNSLSFNQVMILNTSDSVGNNTSPITAKSNTTFTLNGQDSSFGSQVNGSGFTYVAYLFAQNPDLIDCGSYFGTSGQGSGQNAVTCGKGWVPQFVLIKNITTSTTDWVIFDNKRSPNDPRKNTLSPNTSEAERSGVNDGEIVFSNSGFLSSSQSARTNASSNQYIYMAIRAPI